MLSNFDRQKFGEVRCTSGQEIILSSNKREGAVLGKFETQPHTATYEGEGEGTNYEQIQVGDDNLCNLKKSSNGFWFANNT